MSNKVGEYGTSRRFEIDIMILLRIFEKIQNNTKYKSTSPSGALRFQVWNREK